MKYMFLCSTCGNKVFSDGKDLNDFTEVAVASLPKRADGNNKEFAFQKKKLKCDKCGYLLQIIKLTPDKPEEEDKVKE